MPAWSRAGRLILRQGNAVGGCQGKSGTPPGPGPPGPRLPRPPEPAAAPPGGLQLCSAGQGAPRSASWAASPAVRTGRAVPGDKFSFQIHPPSQGAARGQRQQMHLSPVPKARHPLGTSQRVPWAWGRAGSGFGGQGRSPECAPKRKRKYSPKEGINS